MMNKNKFKKCKKVDKCNKQLKKRLYLNHNNKEKNDLILDMSLYHLFNKYK